MKKKSAPRKPSTPTKPLLSTIADEMGSVAGTIVNTTRALAAGAASIVDTATKKATKPKPKPKAKRSAAKKKPGAAKKKGNKTPAKSKPARKLTKSH